MRNASTYSPHDRYVDGESLADDLERFLNHQPLLAAGNPSRRERVANCLKRQRSRAVRAGLVGIAALVLGVALARPVVESDDAHFGISLPEFQNAVAAIEDGNFNKDDQRVTTQGPGSDVSTVKVWCIFTLLSPT